VIISDTTTTAVHFFSKSQSWVSHLLLVFLKSNSIVFSYFLICRLLNINVQIVYCLVASKNSKGEIISRFIISDSDTTTTSVHYLSSMPSSSYVGVNFQFSKWNCESTLLFVCIFKFMSVIIANLCSNYLLHSKLWRRYAIGCCPEILHHRGLASKYYATTYAPPSCITKEPEYCIVIPFFLSKIYWVLILILVVCWPIPGNVNLQKERPVCMSSLSKVTETIT
jgi:hypothetical protein